MKNLFTFRNALSLVIFGAFFIFSPNVSAKDFTWTGNGDGISWKDPKNWDANESFPAKEDMAIFPEGTKANITKDIPEEIHRLVIVAGAYVRLEQNTKLIINGNGSSLPALKIFQGGKLVLDKTFSLQAPSMDVANDSIENHGEVFVGK